MDDYSGLDRFGRVVDMIWADDSDTVLDEYLYGFDAAGNRLWKENALAHDASKNLDEKYVYDELYRLIGTDRGQLDVNNDITSPTWGQDWTLDGLGNFSEFDNDGDIQTRTANEANEIDGISGGAVTPEYDAAGNMISGPKPDAQTTKVHYVYDAWNRLVEVRADDNGSPGDPIAKYVYDGTNRRIEKHTYSGGSLDEIRHYYYNQWQRTTKGVRQKGSGYFFVALLLG